MTAKSVLQNISLAQKQHLNNMPNSHPEFKFLLGKNDKALMKLQVMMLSIRQNKPVWNLSFRPF